MGTEWPMAEGAWCSVLARNRPEERNAAEPVRRAGGAMELADENEVAGAG